MHKKSAETNEPTFPYASEPKCSTPVLKLRHAEWTGLGTKDGSGTSPQTSTQRGVGISSNSQIHTDKGNHTTGASKRQLDGIF